MKLFGFLALFGAASAEVEGSAAPAEARLLASKKTESKILAQNVDLVFNYKIYNIGQQDALNVKMEDNSFNNGFDIVSGGYQASWEVIKPGDSVTHEIVVKALNAGAQNITSAVFTYKTDEAGDEITMYSSETGQALIIEESEYLRKHASHIQDWFVFILLSVPSLVFPYLLYFKSKSKYENKPKRS